MSEPASETNRIAGVCKHCRHSFAWHVITTFRGATLLVCEHRGPRLAADGTRFERSTDGPCNCSLAAEEGWPELRRPDIPAGAGHSWDNAINEDRAPLMVQCGRCDGRGNTQWGDCFYCHDGVLVTDRLIERDTARRSEGFHRNRVQRR